MHRMTDKALRRHARDFFMKALEACDGDATDAAAQAWTQFQTEAQMHYSAEDDGDANQYGRDIANVFDNIKGEVLAEQRTRPTGSTTGEHKRT